MTQLRPIVLGLIFLMLASPLGAMVTSTTHLADEHQTMNAEGWDKDIDVPTWRIGDEWVYDCLLYTSPSPRDYAASRMPSSA